MPIQDIDRGTGPNTLTGDDARTAAEKINSNFAYIMNIIKIKMGGLYVEKYPGNTNLGAYEVGDKVEGWVTSTRYIVGHVVALPFDIDDPTKVKLAIDSETL